MELSVWKCGKAMGGSWERSLLDLGRVKDIQSAMESQAYQMSEREGS